MRPLEAADACRGVRSTRRRVIPKYVIEREMLGVGSLSAEQLRGAAQGSCAVIAEVTTMIDLTTAE